jgi:hypothetical protein
MFPVNTGSDSVVVRIQCRQYRHSRSTKALSEVVNVVCCICTLLRIRFYVQRLMLCCSYLRTQVWIIFLDKGRVCTCISCFVLQSDSCNRAIFTTEVSTSFYLWYVRARSCVSRLNFCHYVKHVSGLEIIIFEI